MSNLKLKLRSRSKERKKRQKQRLATRKRRQLQIHRAPGVDLGIDFSKLQYTDFFSILNEKLESLRAYRNTRILDEQFYNAIFTIDALFSHSIEHGIEEDLLKRAYSEQVFLALLVSTLDVQDAALLDSVLNILLHISDQDAPYGIEVIVDAGVFLQVENLLKKYVATSSVRDLDIAKKALMVCGNILSEKEKYRISFYTDRKIVPILLDLVTPESASNIARYPIFKTAIWVLSNLVQSLKFQELGTPESFYQFFEIFRTFLYHSEEVIYMECIWGMHYLIESNKKLITSNFLDTFDNRLIETLITFYRNSDNLNLCFTSQQILTGILHQEGFYLLKSLQNTPSGMSVINSIARVNSSYLNMELPQLRTSAYSLILIIIVFMGTTGDGEAFQKVLETSNVFPVWKNSWMRCTSSEELMMIEMCEIVTLVAIESEEKVRWEILNHLIKYDVLKFFRHLLQSSMNQAAQHSVLNSLARLFQVTEFDPEKKHYFIQFYDIARELKVTQSNSLGLRKAANFFMRMVEDSLDFQFDYDD